MLSSIALPLMLGGACLVFGTSVARTVGPLAPDSPAGETLSVGRAGWRVHGGCLCAEGLLAIDIGTPVLMAVATDGDCACP